MNGRIIIPSEKLIFSVWMKHFNTLLLTQVLPLESEYLQKNMQYFAPINEKIIFILSKEGGLFSCCVFIE